MVCIDLWRIVEIALFGKKSKIISIYGCLLIVFYRKCIIL